LEKCLSAQNASCRTAATPFFADGVLYTYGMIIGGTATGGFVTITEAIWLRTILQECGAYGSAAFLF